MGCAALTVLTSCAYVSNRMRNGIGICLASVAVLVACVSPQPSSPSPWPSLERERSLDWALLHRCGDVYLSRTPEEKTIETLERRGIELLIDLRDPAVGRDDPVRSTAIELGLDHVALPMPDPGFPSDDQVDEFLAQLAEAADRPLLVFCERGSTSAMLFAIHRAIAIGVDLELAIEEALGAGMKAGAAENFVRDQVERLSIASDTGGVLPVVPEPPSS